MNSSKPWGYKNEVEPNPMDTIRRKEIDKFLKDNPDFYSIWFDRGSEYEEFGARQRIAFTLGYMKGKEGKDEY